MRAKQINTEIAIEILVKMPNTKMKVLENTLYRNSLLTSYYGLGNGTITVYKEGWLIRFDGCRCAFSVWAADNDGEYIFTRKPPDKILHRLYSTSLDFEAIYKQVNALRGIEAQAQNLRC